MNRKKRTPGWKPLILDHGTPLPPLKQWREHPDGSLRCSVRDEQGMCFNFRIKPYTHVGIRTGKRVSDPFFEYISQIQRTTSPWRTVGLGDVGKCWQKCVDWLAKGHWF